MTNRVKQILAVLERATIPSLRENVRDIRDIKANQDDIISALYLAAKLAYAREPDKDETLSEITNALFAYKIVNPHKFLAYLDNHSIIVLQCTLPNDFTDFERGYLRIRKCLKLVSWMLKHNKDDEKSADLINNLFCAIARLYRLDSVKLTKMVVEMYVNTFSTSKCHSDVVGGPDGFDEKDRYALILKDSRIPLAVKAMLDALPRDIVRTEFQNTLKCMKGENAVRLAYVLLRSGHSELAVVLKLLGSDSEKRKLGWKTYIEKAEELVQSPSDIRTPSEVKNRDRPNDNDSWSVDASDRDVFVLEKFLDQGPWHNICLPEIELLILAIRSANWTLVKQIFAALDCNDIAAHPPIAKSLINLMFGVLGSVFDSIGGHRIPNAKKRADAMTNLGFGFALPVNRREDLFDQEGTFFQILSFLGPHTRRSVPLLTMLCEQLRGENLTTNSGAYRIVELVILPAMTLCTSNASIANMVWSLLATCDTNTRWKLYRTLRDSAPKKCVAVSMVSARATLETRRLMKRVTSLSFADYKKPMAKILHCHALAVFASFVIRIRGAPPDRDTLTPFIETLTLGTPLSFDIIASQIVDSLDEKKSRVKSDEYNFENWFASTSLFVGLFLRMVVRESSTVEGVLVYLHRKICKEQEVDYVSVLSNIVLCITEIDAGRSLTGKQQQARGYGVNIRSAAIGKLDSVTVSSVPGKVLDRDEDRTCRSSSICLKKALLQSETNYHFGVGLAKFASKVPNESLNPKIDAMKRDRARNALLQFSELLQYLSGLEMKKDKLMDSSGDSAMESESKDVEMENKDDDKVKEDETTKSNGESAVNVNGAKVKNDSKETVVVNIHDEIDLWARFKATSLKELIDMGIIQYHWYALLRPVIVYPDGLQVVNDWAIETKTLYKAELARTFWTLQLADLDVPKELYEEQSKRMASLISRWKEAYQNYKNREQKASSRKSYKEYSETRRSVEYEYRKFENLEKGLSDEVKVLQRRTDSVTNLLKEGGKSFGEGILNLSASERQTLIQQFAENCFIPRAVSSTTDAIFCVKFVFGLNAVNNEALDLPDLVKYIISRACEILPSATETAASNFGVALRELLTMMDSWRSNKRAFDSNGNHGFRRKDGSLWRHEVYCNWAFEQHATLTSGLIKLLKSSEYLHVRNALAILHIVAGTFPKVLDHGTQLLEATTKHTTSELGDLRLTSKRVVGLLRVNEKTRVPVHMFKLKMKKESEPNRGTKRERSPDAKLEYSKSPKLKDDKRPTDKGKPTVDTNTKRARTPDLEVDGSNAKRGRHGKERITDRLGGKVIRNDNRMRGTDDRRRRSDDGNWENQRNQSRSRDKDESRERRNNSNRDGDDHPRERRNNTNRPLNTPGRSREDEEPHPRERKGNPNRPMDLRDDDEHHPRDRRNNGNRGIDGSGRARDGDDHHPRERRNNNRGMDTPGRPRDDAEHHLRDRRNNANHRVEGPGRQRDDNEHHPRERRNNTNRGMGTPGRQRDGDEHHPRDRRSSGNRGVEVPGRPRDGDEHHPRERRNNPSRGMDMGGRQREGDEPHLRERRNNANRGMDASERPRDNNDQVRDRKNNNRYNRDDGHGPADSNEQPRDRRQHNNRGRHPDERPRDMQNRGDDGQQHNRQRFDGGREQRRPRERDDHNFEGRREQGWDQRENRRRHSDEGMRNRENDNWNHQRYRQDSHHGPPMRDRNRNNRYNNRGPPHPMDVPPHQRRDLRHRRDDRYHHQNERREDGPQYDDMRDNGNYGRPNRRRSGGRPGNQGGGHRR